jgi:2-polyprenyl-3-methyl-5-hydroxy-6-metoxy-1,4-benzoquinol methylase
MGLREFCEDLLVCPFCKGPLQRQPNHYRCPECLTTYDVKNGIPRFLTSLSDQEQQIKSCFNLEHARFLNSRHLHFTPHLVEQWLTETQLPREYFQDKLVLDAGCGTGRWTHAVASLGAKTVAVDLTEEGAEITRQATERMANVAVLQANILNLPLPEESFDFVFSWGVLHHTANTREALGRLVPLVRKGGQLFIMVYERHNPIKFACTAMLRRILQRYPEETRYRFCRYLIIKNPILHLLLKHILISGTSYKVIDPLEISTKQLGLYDAYSPALNHLHTAHEVQSWFRDYQFQQIVLTSPVLFTKTRDVFRWGECGGKVCVRGTRS